MARFEAITGWPGGMLYSAAHGRLYCVAPRGLIPEYPYTMATLRAPTAQEQHAWGTGVQPRMVVDVTGLTDLSRSISVRDLCVAPWNSYLVVRLSEGSVVVAYTVSPALRRLDSSAAGQVAIACGNDVAGWHAELVRQYGGEHWHFTPPHGQPITGPRPQATAAGL
jgi:hypothetical protein